MRAHKLTRSRAKRLRRDLTPPEVALWSQLKGRKLGGLHFRVQHPVGHYILDFYCATARLAVEVDGALHFQGEQPGRDARRDAWLQAQGIEVLRIPAREVRGDLSRILGPIVARAQERIRAQGCEEEGGGAC